MKTTLRGDAATGSAIDVNIHALVPLPFGRINQVVWLLVNVGDIPVRLYLNTVCLLQPMESTAAPVCKNAVLRSCA
eukprot:4462776-Pyramimonas_sp.AAC.1